MNLTAHEAKKFNYQIYPAVIVISFLSWARFCGYFCRVFLSDLFLPVTGLIPAKSNRISQNKKILRRRVQSPHDFGIYRAPERATAQRSGDHGLRWGRRSAMPKIICGSGKSSENANRLAKVLTLIAFLVLVLAGAKDTGMGMVPLKLRRM